VSNGTAFAQTFDGQRAMLDALKGPGRPSTLELAQRLGVNASTARRCLLWLEHEGFVKLVPRSVMRTDVELIRDPGDDELKAAIANRRADI
jgi:DNA-binding transcriptional regulator YhcF (GntR family)